MPAPPSFHEHPNSSALAANVADLLGAIIDQALSARGRAVLALAGGRTPLPIYRWLAEQRHDWARVIVLPTDERWVDCGHPARNDEELAEALQAATGLQLRRLVGDHAGHPPMTTLAHSALADLAGPFDAVLLGMGMDGHTASLFPRSPGLDAAWDLQADNAAFVVEPTPLPAEAPYPRITLGRRRLRDARQLLLTITGAGKRAVLEAATGAANNPAAPISGFFDATATLAVHWSP